MITLISDSDYTIHCNHRETAPRINTIIISIPLSRPRSYHRTIFFQYALGLLECRKPGLIAFSTTVPHDVWHTSTLLWVKIWRRSLR